MAYSQLCLMGQQGSFGFNFLFLLKAKDGIEGV